MKMRAFPRSIKNRFFGSSPSNTLQGRNTKKSRPSFFFGLLCLVPYAILTTSAGTPDAAGAISSSSASYDGNALMLTGQVALDHGLGKMRAEEAILQKQDTGKEFPFSTISLKKTIQIELQDHARLRCNHADLDFSMLRGKLLSSEKEKVIYTDRLNLGHQENSLRLMSDVIDLTFEKMGHSDRRSDFFVQEITATGSVVIDYAQSLTLHAGKALYKKGSDNALRAYPTDAFTTCDIQRGDDHILAEMVEIDVNRHILFLKNPKGLFFSSALPHLQKGEIRFESERLMWDYPQNTLNLLGKTHVEETSFGTLDVDKELTLIQRDEGDSKTIASILTSGRSELKFQAPNRDGFQRIICHGKILLDHENMHAIFESPAKGTKVAKEDQLYYEEGQIAVYADRGVIDYALQDQRLHPSSISLKGNIRILTHNAAQAPRFGLADWVTYSPTTRTFILGAHPGSRVLFWDGKENLRIRAQEIHLTQDENHQTGSVKGIGNVQFSFTADEEALLQKVFNLTKPVSSYVQSQ